MKKLKLFSTALLLISGGMILINACNKNDEEAGIIGTWKVTGALFNPAVDLGAGLTTDAYSLIYAQSCSQDDFIIFQDNGVTISDEGALKCDSTSAQQTTDNYTLSGTTLTIFGNDTTSLTNVSINSSTMSGSLNIDFGTGTPVNIDMTLTRQ
jgi:hypothetical protein